MARPTAAVILRCQSPANQLNKAGRVGFGEGVVAVVRTAILQNGVSWAHGAVCGHYPYLFKTPFSVTILLHLRLLHPYSFCTVSLTLVLKCMQCRDKNLYCNVKCSKWKKWDEVLVRQCQAGMFGTGHGCWLLVALGKSTLIP